MDLVPYLSAVILVATIATLLLAVFSYAAFKMRNSRKPKDDGPTPTFFHRYRIDGDGGDAGASDDEDAA